MAEKRRVARIRVMFTWVFLSFVTLTLGQDHNAPDNGNEPRHFDVKKTVDDRQVLDANANADVAGVRGFHHDQLDHQAVDNKPPGGRKSPSGVSHKQPVKKIAQNPECKKDVELLCFKDALDNNFAVLECLQDKKHQKDVSTGCQSFLWQYKLDLTTDSRFDAAANEACGGAYHQVPECKKEETGTGFRISCLIENKVNITNLNCRSFLTKMASIVFSDYRLIYKFADRCNKDITNFQCGRMELDDEAPHEQGRTLECLSEHVKELDPDCKVEILRVAELQADDYHSDRPLYYACRDDREHFCKRTKAGAGKVFKCLYRHKFERDMSLKCREMLVLRQKLAQYDYKVNKGLAEACQRDIMQNKCINKTDPGFKHARLSVILLCLEGVIRIQKEVAPECILELKEVRRSLMEDYQISPELVVDCAEDIRDHCGGGVHREGKTLHCLMDLAKPDVTGNKEDFQQDRTMKKRIKPQCERALEEVIKQVDPGESWDTDPALKDACQAMVDVHCKEIKPEEGKVISCLMEQVGTKDMAPECEERLMEIEYFLSREFKLNPRLFYYCRIDAREKCHAETNWLEKDEMKPEQGPLVFSCLYRHLKNYATNSQAQLSRACSHEVRRVMRERAVSIHLEPRVEEPCLTDLGRLCSENVDKGAEMECLQDHYDELGRECKSAVGNYTRDEDEDPELDRILMRSCAPMIQAFCQAVMQHHEPGEVMQCLIQHKNDAEMNRKCAAGIEHHQLITMKDYRFSVKFKENCKDDVIKLCKGVKNKGQVIMCLSGFVRNDTLLGKEHRVTKQCRRQLRAELLQRDESINLDTELKNACNNDVDTLCGNITPGKSAVIECLKKHRKELSETCHQFLFIKEKQETLDVTTDFLLMQFCKRMIKHHCPDEEPSELFSCLKQHKGDDDFDSKCRKVIVERLRMKNLDYRLNPNLMKKCKMDIVKYCKEVSRKTGSTETEGLVIHCLRVKFAQKKLSDSCRSHMTGLVQEAAVDFQQDPVLASECSHEIDEFCKDATETDADAGQGDRGKVEECLKINLAAGKITNMKCIKEVARVLAEDKADVHVDPLLYNACAQDIHHYCFDVPRGEGRQMSCLLAALDDRSVRLRNECFRMLQERVSMWNYAAKNAPPESLQDLLSSAATSPSRNYFLAIFLSVIGVIFFGGLCCGRVTKRVRAETKNK